MSSSAGFDRVYVSKGIELLPCVDFLDIFVLVYLMPSVCIRNISYLIGINTVNLI